MRTRWIHALMGWSLALLATVAIPAAATADGPGPRYYLALGTSLSLGIQPDASGQEQPTDEGYPDQLHAALRSAMPRLRLVKLGCFGETSATMISGGLCQYPHRSQLDEAVAFLHAHREAVALVTLDIGANDVQACGSLTGIDQDCVTRAFADVAANLPRILRALRAAAGDDVPVVAMSYYNPFVAAALLGPDGQKLAALSALDSALFNGLLAGIYRGFGVPVADVAAAFHADDFTPVPEAGGVPLNVLLVCEWTWMCAPPPVGPNIHANRDGYAVIAQTFLFIVR